MTTPEHDVQARHRQIGELFHEVLEAPDRSLALERLRRDHADLVSEVASLLRAHDAAGSFIDQPVAASTALSVDAPQVPLEPIGPYRVRGVAGHGGMGIVYMAEDTRLGRVVALKAVKGTSGPDNQRTERLRREARAAAALAHPHIATVYALEEIDGALYLASEFVDGETLRDEVSRGPLSPPRTFTIALAVLDALDAAHRAGIVHRDLKPENIATTRSGQVKVLDFGLAQFEHATDMDRLTRDGTALGTPAYMSPEQLLGEAVDQRSDLFAWGALVVELLTGQHPFHGATQAATIARVIDASPSVSLAPLTESQRPEIAALAAWATRCLAKRPDDRPAAASEIASALRAAARPVSHSAPVLTGRRSGPSPHLGSRRAAWWWQFHQVATITAYVIFLLPLWWTRAAVPEWGRRLFFLGLVAVVTSAMLRLHVWFRWKQLPGGWAAGPPSTRLLIRLADVAFAGVLAGHGSMLIGANDPAATLLIAGAASVLLAAVVIEPATMRAAGEMPGPSSAGPREHPSATHEQRWQ